ncbi:diaminopimelate epimerase [Rhodovibrionaceae bacterium A322]
MSNRPFRKMHGLGNDFVIVDARQSPFPLSSQQAAAIADRRQGVGCDQLIVLEPLAAEDSSADLFMRIYNNDGSEAEACGNATRCVASLLFAESGRDTAVIRTLNGNLACQAAKDDLVTVDMGPAYLNWDQVPLAREMDTLQLDLTVGPLSQPTALSVGNPHAVFIIDDLTTDLFDLPLEELGPQIEHHPLYPNRTNVQLVQPLTRDHLKQRIWERGAGITLASGSGACAAIVGAVRRGVCDRKARIDQPGGTLYMEWREEDGHVLMTGPVATAFLGTLDARLLG